jgi:hypothetical protein
MEIRFPAEKVAKVKKDMKTLIRMETITLRKLAAFVGLLRATSTAVFLARHYTMSMLQQLHKGLDHPENTHHSWNWRIPVTEDCKKAARWWLEHIHFWNGRSMVQESPDITIETDASDFGWGFAVATRTVGYKTSATVDGEPPNSPNPSIGGKYEQSCTQ